MKLVVRQWRVTTTGVHFSSMLIEVKGSGTIQVQYPGGAPLLTPEVAGLSEASSSGGLPSQPMPFLGQLGHETRDTSPFGQSLLSSSEPALLLLKGINDMRVGRTPNIGPYKRLLGHPPYLTGIIQR